MANKTLLPPGFRFHPTDVELVSYYLKRKVMGRPFQFMAISDVELYKFSPWDLPAKSCLRSKDLEWFFFSPRDKKYPKGTRANRSTTTGFWKTTGQDRTITLNARTVGMKKTLIFHTGKPPRGERTDWVMYEYRLTDDNLSASVAQDAYVLCKIFQKSGMGPKIGEQYGAPFNEQEWEEYDDVDYEAASHAFPFLPPQSGAIVLQNGATPPQSSVIPPPSGAAGSVATGDVSGAIMPSPVVPEALEMEGIELDELAHLLMDSPYRADNAHLQFLPAQQEANLAENIRNYNEDGLFNELENLLNSFPNNNEASSSIQPVLSELGSENYLELNDIFAPGNGQDGYGWLYPQFSYEPSQMDVGGGYMSSAQGQNGPISELDQVVNYNGYPSSSDPPFGSSMFAPFQ